MLLSIFETNIFLKRRTKQRSCSSDFVARFDKEVLPNSPGAGTEGYFSDANSANSKHYSQHLNGEAKRVTCQAVWGTPPRSCGEHPSYTILCLHLFISDCAGLCCCKWASHCGGFFCCRARAVGCAGLVAVAHGLSCPGACRIFPGQGSDSRLLHWRVAS